MSYFSHDSKQLRSGFPKNLEYLFGNDLNQKVQVVTKRLKTRSIHPTIIL